jgi:hypothetical protein
MSLEELAILYALAREPIGWLWRRFVVKKRLDKALGELGVSVESFEKSLAKGGLLWKLTSGKSSKAEGSSRSPPPST